MLDDPTKFLQVLTVVLIGLLFFREDIIPFVKSWLGISNKGEHSTRAQMEVLTQYYNHDTSRILNDLSAKTDRMQHTLEDTNENVKNIARKQEEWERHGVPTKCK